MGAAPVAPPAGAPPAGVPPAAANPPRDEKLWQSACEFEAVTIGELLKPMFATVDTAHGPFGGGAGEAAWQPMMIDAIAKQMAAKGGIGLAGAVYAELLHRQEAAAGPSGNARPRAIQPSTIQPSTIQPKE